MKVRDIFTDPSRWCRITYAITQDGVLCHPGEPQAYSFCLVGAVMHCYEDTLPVMQKLEKACDPLTPTLYNDTKSFREIQKLVQELDI